MIRSGENRRPRPAQQVVCGLIGLWLAAAVAPGLAQECAFVGNQLIGTVRVLSVPDGLEIDLKTLPDCDQGICQLTDIAVDRASGEAFVSQLDGNRIWVVDPSSGADPTSIALASAPTDVAFRPDGSELLVISGATAEAAVIDASTKAENGRIALPSQPRGLAFSPDGTILATTSRSQNTVSILNSADGTVLRTANTGERPIAVAISPDGNLTLAAAEDGTLTVVEVSSGSVVDTVTVGELPAAVAVHPNGETAYVANRGDDTVSVVTIATGDVTSVEVGRSPVALAVTDDGMVLVANLQGASLSILDSSNGHNVLGPISAGVSPFALTAAPCPGTGGGCTGDCNADDAVGINELIIGVNINLGNRDIGDCLAFDENRDESIAISELIRGVRNNLDGCPS